MKKKLQTQKKLSLNKLQIAKINNPKTIKGGQDPNTGNTGNTDTQTLPTETK